METALHDAAATLPAACACFEFPKQWCRSAGVARLGSHHTPDTTTGRPHPRVCTVFAPVVARRAPRVRSRARTHTHTHIEATNKCRRPESCAHIVPRTKRERKSETRIGLIKASKQCWMPPMAQQRVVSQITVRHVAHRCASNAEQCPIRRSAGAPFPLRASLSPRSPYRLARSSSLALQIRFTGVFLPVAYASDLFETFKLTSESVDDNPLFVFHLTSPRYRTPV